MNAFSKTWLWCVVTGHDWQPAKHTALERCDRCGDLRVAPAGVK